MDHQLRAVLALATPGALALVVGARWTLLLPLVVTATFYVGMVAGWWEAGV